MNTVITPLTGDDLVRIGHLVDDVIDRLKMLEDGEKTEMLIPGINEVVVEILRPDSDDVVGEVRWAGDGWWAYYPYGVA